MRRSPEGTEGKPGAGKAHVEDPSDVEVLIGKKNLGKKKDAGKAVLQGGNGQAPREAIVRPEVELGLLRRGGREKLQGRRIRERRKGRWKKLRCAQRNDLASGQGVAASKGKQKKKRSHIYPGGRTGEGGELSRHEWKKNVLSAQGRSIGKIGRSRKKDAGGGRR